MYPCRDGGTAWNNGSLPISWHKTVNPMLCFDLALQELHLLPLPVHQHHVPRLAPADQLHDPLGVGVRRKRHVLDRHFHLRNLPLLKLYPLLTVENLVTDCASDTISRHDYHVPLLPAPPSEDGQRKTSVKHPRGCKHHHGARVVHIGTVICFDVLEVEHVAVNKSLSDLFVGPRDEHLVVVVCLLRHAGAEVDGALEVHSLPVGLQQDAELLRPAQGKDWDQHLPSFINAVVHLLQKITLSAPFAVSDSCGISGFRYQEIRSAFVDPGCAQVSVGSHIVVSGVNY